MRLTRTFYSYVVALLVCLAAVGLFLLMTPQSRTERIPKRDYSITLANFNRAVPYKVWGPAQDPGGWVPNSNRIADGANGAKVLYLGYATAKREHAMFAQSGEQPSAGFGNRMANSDKSVGTEQVNGQPWDKRFREDKNQRTLIRTLPGVTLVVTGTADWPELAQLAAALKEVPKPAA
ncbi:DUF4245 domain-containing protein [Nonomuraea sp. NPDC059023]|uniref:DUF4245 domain-containing protein n=1 Tax=unclassified Nonomuraea TaxID=2593643 RepID=UPI0036CE5740